MYLLLLVFGGVLTAAGILLAASGVSIHDHIFDTSIITPGVVAAVGGLLLIGLGLALRVLQRIERALALRPVLRAVPTLAAEPETVGLLHPPVPTPRPQPAPVAAPTLAAEPETVGLLHPPISTPRPQPAIVAAPTLAAEPETVGLLHPPMPTPRPQPAPVAATASVAIGDTPAERKPEKSPLVARLEAARVVAETEVSLSPHAAMPVPTSVDIAVAQVDKAQAAKRKNGATPPGIAPGLDVGPRSPSAPERSANPSFDALWPKPPRPARPAQPASGQAAPAPMQAAVAPVQAAAASAAELEQMPEPAVETPQPAAMAASEPVAVLKSGVVDGMAYTLYSDGSIEAQLPQGTLRFGSITELRNHIEQSA